MRKASPTLVELWCCDVILARAGRERPHGYTCALAREEGGAGRSCRELTGEQIDHALYVASVVNSVSPDYVRRVLALAMVTDRGDPLYSRRGIAKTLRCSEATVTRALRAGLKQVEAALSRVRRETFTPSEPRRTATRVFSLDA